VTLPRVAQEALANVAKLNVNDRAAAVAAGFERGLLPRATE